eukprot:jgi/Hompol1/1102/HPOL_001635-RA
MFDSKFKQTTKAISVTSSIDDLNSQSSYGDDSVELEDNAQQQQQHWSQQHAEPYDSRSEHVQKEHLTGSVHDKNTRHTDLRSNYHEDVKPIDKNSSSHPSNAVHTSNKPGHEHERVVAYSESPTQMPAPNIMPMSGYTPRHAHHSAGSGFAQVQHASGVTIPVTTQLPMAQGFGGAMPQMPPFPFSSQVLGMPIVVSPAQLNQPQDFQIQSAQTSPLFYPQSLPLPNQYGLPAHSGYPNLGYNHTSRLATAAAFNMPSYKATATAATSFPHNQESASQDRSPTKVADLNDFNSVTISTEVLEKLKKQLKDMVHLNKSQSARIKELEETVESQRAAEEKTHVRHRHEQKALQSHIRRLETRLQQMQEQALAKESQIVCTIKDQFRQTELELYKVRLEKKKLEDECAELVRREEQTRRHHDAVMRKHVESLKSIDGMQHGHHREIMQLRKLYGLATQRIDTTQEYLDQLISRVKISIAK